MIEFYKYLYDLSAPIIKETFIKRIVKYNLRNCRVTFLPNPKTKKLGYKVEKSTSKHLEKKL